VIGTRYIFGDRCGVLFDARNYEKCQDLANTGRSGVHWSSLVDRSVDWSLEADWLIIVRPVFSDLFYSSLFLLFHKRVTRRLSEPRLAQS
jgi:hypothetical protein